MGLPLPNPSFEAEMPSGALMEVMFCERIVDIRVLTSPIPLGGFPYICRVIRLKRLFSTFFQVRKQRPPEVLGLVQDHTSSKSRTRILDPDWSIRGNVLIALFIS